MVIETLVKLAELATAKKAELDAVKLRPRKSQVLMNPSINIDRLRPGGEVCGGCTTVSQTQLLPSVMPTPELLLRTRTTLGRAVGSAVRPVKERGDRHERIALSLENLCKSDELHRYFVTL